MNCSKKRLEGLATKLAFSYNGILVDCKPSQQSSIIGTVLTRHGHLISRDSRDSNWENICTPSIYLFYDNETCITYAVNTCERSIHKVKPCGRILDCTDRVIYEIKDDEWCPICNLKNKKQRFIVLCNSVPANATEVTFEFSGSNPKVDPFSEIPADRVTFSDGHATVTFDETNLPPEGCSVLLFHVKLCCESTTIAKIFIRASAPPVITITPRYSAIGGSSAENPIQNFPITIASGFPLLDIVLPSPNVAIPIINWIELYDRPSPGSFNPSIGTYTIITPGDYDIEAVFSYKFSNIEPVALPTQVSTTIENDTLTRLAIVTAVPRTRVPYFALIRTRGNTNAIVAVAPVEANRRNLLPIDFEYLLPQDSTAQIEISPQLNNIQAFDIIEVANVSINIGLPLFAGDILRLVFILDSEPDTLLQVIGLDSEFNPVTEITSLPFGQVPNMIGLGTTFNGELLGPSNILTTPIITSTSTRCRPIR